MCSLSGKINQKSQVEMLSDLAVIKSDVGWRDVIVPAIMCLRCGGCVLTDRSGPDSSRWHWGKGRGDATDSTRVTWTWTRGKGVSSPESQFHFNPWWWPC
jgi:hypothetical protein